MNNATRLSHSDRPRAGRPFSPRLPGGRGLLLFFFGVFICSAPFRAEAGELNILRLYTWSEYFSANVIAEFEEKHGCVVAVDLFDSNEAMYEHIIAGEDRYDIVTPSSYMAAEMRRRGLLLPINHGLVPNLKEIDPAFLPLTEDPEMTYSVPYTRTVTGIGYRKSLLGDFPPGDRAWAVFSRRDLAGRMTMLDDMRETIGAALKSLGYSLNSTDPEEIAKAGELLGKWRANLARFEVDEANIGLGAGEYALVHGYNGDLAVLMEENDDVDFFVPGEGSAVTTDQFVVLAGSAKAELAHAFINHFLEPRAAAANMTDILYYMPVPAAFGLLGDEVKENHAFSVPEEVMSKCEVIRDVGTNIEAYERVWERLQR